MGAPTFVRALAVLALLASATGCAAAGTSSAPASQEPPPTLLVTPPPGFPTGTFTKEISADDYVDASVTDPAAGNNTGRFTLTLGQDGRWTNVLDSLGATQVNPVFRGTYRVDGTNLAFTTDFPREYAGAVAQYAWRVDDEGLWTTIVSSPDPLEVLLAKAIDAEPWAPAP